MARKRPVGPPGTVVILEHKSRLLARNPLGDPHVRKLAVWLPPRIRRRRVASGGPGRRFPVLYDLVGFMGSGLAHLNWKRVRRERGRARRAAAPREKMGPAILVFPDCFTALGGNQYVNSSAIGRYADYLLKEIIPFVDARIPHARVARAPRLLRQVVGRLRRDRSRHEVRAALGRDRRSFGRCLFRFRLRRATGRTRSTSSRSIASRSASAGEQSTAATSRTDRACADGIDDGRVARFLDDVWKKPKLSHAEGHAIMNVVHGGHLRSRSRRAARLSAAVSPRDRRAAAGALAALAAHDPVQMVKRYAREPALAARDLHRLRLARPVPASTSARGSCRNGCRRRGIRTSLRRVRRRPLRRRLPHGREPAVSIPGDTTVSVTGAVCCASRLSCGASSGGR